VREERVRGRKAFHHLMSDVMSHDGMGWQAREGGEKRKAFCCLDCLWNVMSDVTCV